MTSLDSFKCRRPSRSAARPTVYYSLPTARRTSEGISKLPYSMKVLLENLLRNEDDRIRQEGRHRAVSKC